MGQLDLSQRKQSQYSHKSTSGELRLSLFGHLQTAQFAGYPTWD